MTQKTVYSIDSLQCPHCSYMFRDSWELGESDDDMECDNCGKHFSYDSDTVRTFTSRKREDAE